MTQRHLFPPLTLCAEALQCGRGGMALTAPLSLTVESGQCLLLRGPNGTGKTTLLLTLAGIVPPLEGKLAIKGRDEDARVLHYCGHRNAIKPRLTVAENLDFWAEVNGPSGTSVDEALGEVGLGHLAELDAGYLSAGQGRRLALARLLVSQRPLWLLDEPTAALDVEGHALVTRLLDRHLSLGGMAIAATHDAITLPDSDRVRTLFLGVGR
ncbi:MAG TPA: heme ABC exporter ATP-binding protein CcmA [Devosia sp.]|uniref:heme ABC exporter ATP-binding protein CcmA n=1 Tax=Devosia sp. TaxID=1871048 RepID=UPI002F94C941